MKRRILSLFLAAVMMLSAAIMSIPASAELNFNDTDGHWGVSAIEYVVENGLMNGVGNGESFAPDMSLTRGMVVTVLYRDNGSPKAGFEGTFLDVAEGAYYTAAAEWAFASGIVNGTGFDDWGEPYFSPDRDITRQELATMFKRYADFKHVDTAKGATDINSFPDASSVADWAGDAVKWAVGVGLITGKANGGQTTLSPTDKAVRAEFATIIKRFKEADFEYRLYYADPQPISRYTELEYTLVNDADVYVAVDGSDSNPGTLSKPLATFEAAKAKVREIRKTAKDEIVVAFKAGNYGMLNNLTFTEEDAGTENIPVKYCKYGDGNVVFQNGILLKETDFSPVEESDYYLLGSVDKSKVYKIDLSGKIDSFSDKNIVFSSTGMCHEARIPNKRVGIENAYWNVTTTYNERESILLQNYLPGIVKEFRTLDGMKVTGMLRTGWLVDTFPVKSFDEETGILTFDFENYTFDNGYDLDDFVLAYEGRMDDYIYFHNLSDQIDAEGEYWFDNSTSILYIYKPVGDHYISTGGTFLSLINETEYLSFVGFDFVSTMSDAIDMDANHITFDRCTIGNVAGSACINTEWDYRVNNITIKNCEFYNFYDKGVDIFGSWPALECLTPSHIVIDNNYFHDFSSPQTFGAGVNLTNTVGTNVTHNEFVNGAHAGVSFGDCIDLIIEYNIFENMMSSTSDYGAVYSFRVMVYQGNIMRHNLFKNIRVAGAQYAIYNDGSYGQEIYGNLFYNAGERSVVLNGGRDNKVHDNVLIGTSNFKGSALVYNSDLSGIDENGNPYANNEEKYQMTLGYLGRKPSVDSEHYQKWYDRWPILYNYTYDIANVGKFDCLFTTVNEIKNNTYINIKVEKSDIYEEFAIDEGNASYTLDENYFFKNPTHGDYSIIEGADIYDIQFEKIGRY